ncbi:cation:proton antiporter [bacterium SM23_31]|nr:MAG: cation:proton antiporter [bacterium SM23_31]
MTIYLMCFFLFVMGLYCLIAKKHLIKKIIGIAILDYAVNLFLILIGYKSGGIPPVLFEGMNKQTFSQQSVDPLPQALVLTSIVISLGVLIMMVSIALRLYEKYKTFDTSEISRLRG